MGEEEEMYIQRTYINALVLVHPNLPALKAPKLAVFINHYTVIHFILTNHTLSHSKTHPANFSSPFLPSTSRRPSP